MVSRSLRNRTYAYIGTRKRCGACALKAQCTSEVPSAFLPFTWTRLPGNARGTWRTRQSLPRHSGKERRWKPCSRNSRIRSDCVASVCGDYALCGSSSSWRPRPRTSSD
jgi:hypothetical protein